MAKPAAVLMSTAAHPPKLNSSKPTEDTSAKPAQRTRGWPPQQPRRSSNRRAQRTKPVAGSGDSDYNDGEDEPDDDRISHEVAPSLNEYLRRHELEVEAEAAE